MIPIAESLLETGDWLFSPPSKSYFTSDSQMDPNSAEELWLRRANDGFGPDIYLCYIDFYTEDRYHLPIRSCLEYEAPDLIAGTSVAFEEEYDRDPHHRFGPGTWAMDEAESLVLCSTLARSPKNTIPIFVPSISAHANALLRQVQHEKATKIVSTLHDRGPGDYLFKFVIELCLNSEMVFEHENRG